MHLILTARLFARAAAVLTSGMVLILVDAPWGRSQTTVAVNAASVRAVMPDMGLGIHTSPYYNDMSHPNVDELLEQAGVTTLRYGGGGYADVLHWSITRASWENGITGGGLSPWWGQAGNFGYVGPGSDFASFVSLLDRVDNSRAVITVNTGAALKLIGNESQVPDFAGQPKEAAAWVAYANADPSIYGTPNDIVLGVDEQGNDWKTAGYWARLRASTAAEYQSWARADRVLNPLNTFLAIDRDAPLGVKYWEIGNETFGTGYYGGGNGYALDYSVPYDGTNRDDHPDLSPAHYGDRVVEYAQLMKQVDPTIKIGAVLATPPDDYSWSYADLNDSGSKQVNEPYWNDEVLAHAASATDFVMVHWYPWAGNNADGSSLLSQVRTKLPQMINGTTAGQDSGTNAGLRDTLAAYGIPDAEIMVTEFNYMGSLDTSIRTPTMSVFVADAYATWLGLGVTSVDFLEMLTADFLNDPSGMAQGPAYYGVSMVDKLVEPGESLVSTTSTNNNIRAHAALQSDGSLTVMLLNHNLSGSANVNVNISGVDLDSTGTLYSLTGGTSLTTTPLTGLGEMFSVNVPARSIAVYHIDAAPSQPGDFDDDLDVDGEDFLAWQRGETDPPHDPSALQAWHDHYGTQTLSAATAVPEPATCALTEAVLVTILAVRRRARFFEPRKVTCRI